MIEKSIIAINPDEEEEVVEQEELVLPDEEGGVDPIPKDPTRS